MKSAHEHTKIWLCLLLVPIPLFLPYLWLDNVYFWANPDSIFYINVYASYRDALWQGELFPHWIANTNIGLGSLVFYSLSPLVFSITAIASAPFGFSELNQYLFGIYVSQVFAGFAMYRWMRGHYEKSLALCAAALFVFVPYKWIDLYQHFTLGQSWAIAFLPLWFLSAERIKSRAGIVLYGMAAALTFYAHALTVISVGPVVVAYALHRANWQWKSLVKPLLVANFLAFCLIASYLAAMVTAMPWLHIERWSDNNYNPLKNLYHIDDFIGAYALLLIWLIYRSHRSLVVVARAGGIYFWSIVLITLYVIATPLSYPLWASVPAMNVFQFPFPRLQPAMAVIVVVFGTYLLAAKKKEFTIAIVAVYLLFSILILVHLKLVYNRPRDLSMRVREVAAQHHIIPGPIHMPRWTDIEPNDLLVGHKRYKELPVAELKDGEAVVDDSIKSDGRIVLDVTVSSTEATMVVSQFYIPAWKATMDGHSIEISPYSDGFIKIQLPKGTHQLELAITKSFMEKMADAITFLGIILVAIHYSAGLVRRVKA